MRDWRRRLQVKHLLGATLAVAAVVFTETGGLPILDQVFYDVAVRHSGRPTSGEVVIIAIDQKSLSTLGRWPWKRRTHAALLERLAPTGAKAIVFDIAFSEPDLHDPEGDALLVRATAESGKVVFPVLLEQDSDSSRLREILPIPGLVRAAAALGHVDTELDRDGIARTAFLEAGLERPKWPALALAGLRVGAPAPSMQLPGERNRNLGTDRADTWVRDYRILIPFSGPPGHFPRLSYSDVLAGLAPPSLFRGKRILIGATSTGLGDSIPTPVSGFGSPMSGVEFNANVLDALIEQRAVVPLPHPWQVALNLLFALTPFLLYPRLAARWSPLAALTLLILALGGSFLALSHLQLWFPPATAGALAVAGFFLLSWRHLQGLMGSLLEERVWARSALTAVADAVIRTDEDGRVEYMSPIAETLTGYRLEEARGAELGRVLKLATEDRPSEPLSQPLRQRRSFDALTLIGRDGSKVPVKVSAGPIAGSGNKATGTVITITDTSESRRLTQRIEYQQTHDSLTRLPNEALLNRRLEAAVCAGHPFAVLCIGLDRFDELNSALGHLVSDELLQTVAARLDPLCREQDTLAHLGRDEFVIVARGLGEEARARALANQVRRCLEPTIFLDGQRFDITASIGISLFLRDGRDGAALLRDAAAAMHAAKHNGGDKLELFHDRIQETVRHRVLMEQHLRRAIKDGELEIHYQPLVELARDRISAVEALVRWRDAGTGELIYPDRFIPLAEDTGLIVPIGKWLLEEACGQVREWQGQGLSSIRLSANISPRQITEPGFLETVQGALSRSGLAPELLELEITENMLLREDEHVGRDLLRLHSMGLHFAIDDFGTGYSSMAYLTRFPFRRLKIDKSFVREVDNKPEFQTLVSAMISLAHGLHMQVVAEGVETAAEGRYLRANGCDELQGYLLSAPLPAEECAALLQSSAENFLRRDADSCSQYPPFDSKI